MIRRNTGRSGRVELERGIPRQDRPLELLHARARFQAKLLGQCPPKLLIERKCFGLAPAAVQSEHQLRAEALAQRVAFDQRRKLGDEIPVASERQIRLNAVLHGPEIQLLQLRDRNLGKRLVGEVRERRTAPQPQGIAQRPGSLAQLARCQRLASPLDQASKPVEVKLTRTYSQQVPVGAGDEHRIRSVASSLVAVVDRTGPAVIKGLAQSRDMRLQGSRRGRRRPLAPQTINQPVSRHDLIAVQQQDRQQRPLLLAQRDRPVTVPNLDRAEDPKLHTPSP
jgi:hypothetical protein